MSATGGIISDYADPGSDIFTEHIPLHHRVLL